MLDFYGGLQQGRYLPLNLLANPTFHLLLLCFSCFGFPLCFRHLLSGDFLLCLFLCFLAVGLSVFLADPILLIILGLLFHFAPEHVFDVSDKAVARLRFAEFGAAALMGTFAIDGLKKHKGQRGYGRWLFHWLLQRRKDNFFVFVELFYVTPTCRSTALCSQPC